MSVQSRVRGAATLLALVVLAGCGGGDGDGPVAAASPAPTPGVFVAGDAGVQPFAEPACRAPRRAEERDAPGVTRAAEQLRALGAKKGYASRYAGLVPCVPTKTIVIFRVPMPGKEFKAEAQKIARQNRVQVEFADALFTHRQAVATKKAVLGRFADLDRAGAPFAFVRIHENGTAEVGVLANLAGAEKVLADLLDRVFVVQVPETTAAPAPR